MPDFPNYNLIHYKQKRGDTFCYIPSTDFFQQILSTKANLKSFGSKKYKKDPKFKKYHVSHFNIFTI